MYVQPKKALGQHFLKDQDIAQRIVEALAGFPLPEALSERQGPTSVLEVGPGTGVLTQYLLQNPQIDLRAVELDGESVDYLLLHFPALRPRLIQGDFLRMDLEQFFPEPFMLIGNFPYNISSQIFFKVLEVRHKVPVVVGMLQKEVAERIAAPPGSKTYGILSVLLQAWYDIEYLFTVSESVFQPPPKVKSAVIRLVRNQTQSLPCSEVLFTKVVKTTFNQRRKAIRNSIRPLTEGRALPAHPLFTQRPEQLSVAQFTELTQLVENLTSN